MKAIHSLTASDLEIKRGENNMSMMKEVHNKMVQAMKARDKDSKDAYSSILAAMKSKAKDLRVEELNDEQATEVVVKMAKQNQESIDTCPSGRVDSLEKLKFERSIILQFMPKQMSEAEIEQTILETLNELGLDAPKAKDKGAIMKVLMPKVKGKADGKLVNTVLQKHIG